MVTSEGVTLVTGFGPRTISFSDVKEARLRVIQYKGKHLRVRLALSDGSEVDAQPLGCDSFEVLRTLRTAISLSRS